MRESTPLNPRLPYAISKAGQEGVAVEAGARWGFPIVVTRSFNHTGPGQRSVFVAPAMARRVLAVKRGGSTLIPAGNVDVYRDIGDVRDVVRAYRLLLEALAIGRLGTNPVVVNVSTGRAETIRSVIEQLCALAGIEAAIQTDPALVRAEDPPGDSRRCLAPYRDSQDGAQRSRFSGRSPTCFRRRRPIPTWLRRRVTRPLTTEDAPTENCPPSAPQPASAEMGAMASFSGQSA